MMEIMKVTKFFRRVGKKISRSKKVEPLSGVFFYFRDEFIERRKG